LLNSYCELEDGRGSMSLDYSVHYCECAVKDSVLYDKITDQAFCGRCEGVIREEPLTPEAILKVAVDVKQKADKLILERGV